MGATVDQEHPPRGADRRRVLVLGACGHLGRLALAACRERGDLEVRGASRREGAADERVDLTDPVALFDYLNLKGGKHGVGRLDLVENRFVGMKSRGMYETPGGEIYARAHRGIEQLTLDRGAAHLKDELMPKYAELIYNGFWFAPEREMLQAAIDKSQERVTGTVRLKLYKGNVIVAGRKSPTHSLFDESIATFEDDAGAYDQKDAGGFIKLNALRLRTISSKRGTSSVGLDPNAS